MIIPLVNATRKILGAGSGAVISALKPVKMYAYHTRIAVLRRAILEATTFVDFSMVFLNIQNPTMMLHWERYGRGNFPFGKGIMVTDWDKAACAIARDLYKNNDFMGVRLVSSESEAFFGNAGILLQCPPIRNLTRHYLDEHVFTPEVHRLDFARTKALIDDLIADWQADPHFLSTLGIRTAVTRIFLKILSGKTVPHPDADHATRRYIRHFVEMSLFAHYFPGIYGLLGTSQKVRKDSYFRLRDFGIDTLAVDITLFAAAFSIGTLVLQCVEDAARHDIEYRALTRDEKRNFITESVRLWPTVTSVHRVVEKPETVEVLGKTIQLDVGDEVIYPFICTNRDPRHFKNPDTFDIHRPSSEYEKVLSWSKGPHECPAKELSILVVMLMLDTLDAHKPLRELEIFNPQF